MASEVAVRNGVGSVVLDVRRGDGPPASHYYTFPALVTKDSTIEQDPESVSAAVRAFVKVQRELRANPHRATEVGERLFPAAEAALISDLVSRDLPYYDPVIAPEVVANMNSFARDIGLLSTDASYDQVVASQIVHLWTE